MEHELPNMPNLYFWVKDNNLNYLDCNERFAEMAGADSAFQMKGKSDLQMCWSESADFYRMKDASVLKGSYYISSCEEVRNFKGEIIKMITVRSPYYGQSGECLGVIGTGVQITQKCLNKKDERCEIKNSVFQLGEEFCNEYLTKRELDVLKYVLLGHTSKVVAKLLNLSPRTVESYIQILKEKLQCNSKADIISTAIKAGFYYLIEEVT